MEKKQGLRLYFFVMYNLSGIQKGIQAGHAALEYAKEFGHTDEYKEFIEHHKTFILLDGGGSDNMLALAAKVWGFTDIAIFKEPDLNNSLSAIAFLVPESVYGLDPEDTGTVYDGKTYRFYEFLKGFRLASN